VDLIRGGIETPASKPAELDGEWKEVRSWGRLRQELFEELDSLSGKEQAREGSRCAGGAWRKNFKL